MPALHILPEQWTGRTDPEDGDNALRLHHFESTEAKRAIIGFRCDAGVKRNQGRIGAKEGPQALRNALSNLAAPLNMRTFSDLGDIEVTDDDLETGQDLLAAHITKAFSKFEQVIVFGGGHETAWASYQGISKHFNGQKIGIINLDAHLDLRNTGEKGPSSGTPFNQIRQSAPEKFDYLCIGVAEEANTLSLFERAKEWGVEIIKDKELISDTEAADASISAIARRSDLLYVTIDIDLLPAYQAPGVSSPAARGVPLETVEHLLNHIIHATHQENCFIPLIDIVELSPPFDRDNITAKSAALLIWHFLSHYS